VTIYKIKDTCALGVPIKGFPVTGRYVHVDGDRLVTICKHCHEECRVEVEKEK
jgi:hypothetical protein